MKSCKLELTEDQLLGVYPFFTELDKSEDLHIEVDWDFKSEPPYIKFTREEQ